MKVIRLKNNRVVEIIPEYALPVEKWYGEKFASECLEAPDEVQTGWKYINGSFYDYYLTQEELESLKSQKEQFLSSSCNSAITAGMDVETTQGTEHFSLEETDQINLTTAYNAVKMGAEGYPYHADKKLCRMFTAKEIEDISNASIQHKLYHTTLCNHLLTWVRRSTTEEELNEITYSADNLPNDLKANMEEVLANSQAL